MSKMSKTAARKSSESPGFLVRIPTAYREKLQQLRKTSHRSFTGEVQTAIDKHLKENGIDPPAAA